MSSNNLINDSINTWSTECRELFKQLKEDQRSCFEKYGAFFFPVKNKNQIRCGWPMEGGTGIKNYNFALIDRTDFGIKLSLRVGENSGFIGSQSGLLKPVSASKAPNEKDFGFVEIRFGEIIKDDIFNLIKIANELGYKKYILKQ
jgi:hypothetical protein